MAATVLATETQPRSTSEVSTEGEALPGARMAAVVSEESSQKVLREDDAGPSDSAPAVAWDKSEELEIEDNSETTSPQEGKGSEHEGGADAPAAEAEAKGVKGGKIGAGRDEACSSTERRKETHRDKETESATDAGTTVAPSDTQSNAHVPEKRKDLGADKREESSAGATVVTPEVGEPSGTKVDISRETCQKPVGSQVASDSLDTKSREAGDEERGSSQEQQRRKVSPLKDAETQEAPADSQRTTNPHSPSLDLRGEVEITESGETAEADQDTDIRAATEATDKSRATSSGEKTTAATGEKKLRRKKKEKKTVFESIPEPSKAHTGCRAPPLARKDSQTVFVSEPVSQSVAHFRACEKAPEKQHLQTVFESQRAEKSTAHARAGEKLADRKDGRTVFESQKSLTSTADFRAGEKLADRKDGRTVFES
ncbi:hypothetical protein TGARI_205320, partial [Toxoplasma gondii ARI]